MFSNNLTSIDGVYIYPVIALVIFFSLFVGILIWTVRIKQSYISEMENLPLDETETQLKNSGSDNEN